MLLASSWESSLFVLQKTAHCFGIQKASKRCCRCLHFWGTFHNHDACAVRHVYSLVVFACVRSVEVCWSSISWSCKWVQETRAHLTAIVGPALHTDPEGSWKIESFDDTTISGAVQPRWQMHSPESKSMSEAGDQNEVNSSNVAHVRAVCRSLGGTTSFPKQWLRLAPRITRASEHNATLPFQFDQNLRSVVADSIALSLVIRTLKCSWLYLNVISFCEL